MVFSSPQGLKRTIIDTISKNLAHSAISNRFRLSDGTWILNVVFEGICISKGSDSNQLLGESLRFSQ